MLVDLVGFLAGAILAVSFLPQVIQTWRTRCADDISLSMMSLTLLSTVLYEIYAALLGLWPVVIMNGLFGVLVATEIGLKIAFTKKVPVVERS